MVEGAVVDFVEDFINAENLAASLRLARLPHTVVPSS